MAAVPWVLSCGTTLLVRVLPPIQSEDGNLCRFFHPPHPLLPFPIANPCGACPTRRRSKINEKMKALQSLIPNSNKTDKASMLDEAIEYLKQLQLQVQMLSMRNGVYLNPPYLSCALEPVQASQMFAALGGGNITASSTGAVMPPVNQSSGTHQAFDPLNPPQNQPLSFLLPSVPDKTIPERQFHLEPSQSHLQTFRMPESSEMMLRGEIMAKHQLMFSVSARLLVHGQQNYKYCSISLRMEIVAKAPMMIASTVLGQIAWSKSDMSMFKLQGWRSWPRHLW